MGAKDYISTSLQEHIDLAGRLSTLAPVIEAASDAIARAFRSEKKLLICGNGGSAADAQHIAAEFVGRFMRERKAYPAIALQVNSSSVTAISNDYGYESVFAREVEAFGQPGDVLIAISTSGNSANVNNAARKAADSGLHVIGLVGRDGGDLKGLCHQSVVIPSMSTPRIQEMHITVGHIICGLVEDALC